MPPFLLALLPTVAEIINKIIPDPKAAAEAKLKMLEMAQNGELEIARLEATMAGDQARINEAEATTDAFRGGWRPAIGWVCASGFAYTFLAKPLLPWAANLFGAGVPDLPDLAMGELMTLALGMLGLGGLRTFERIKGKA